MSNLIYSSHRKCTYVEEQAAKRLFKNKKWSLPPTAVFQYAQVNNVGDVIEAHWFSKRKQGVLRGQPRAAIHYNILISAPKQ